MSPAFALCTQHEDISADRGQVLNGQLVSVKSQHCEESEVSSELHIPTPTMLWPTNYKQ